jgi:protein NrfC
MAAEKNDSPLTGLSRRDFIKFSGMAISGIYMIGCEIGKEGRKKAEWGFILVDMKKCQGCQSCMLACSLVHEGIISLSASRIQILSDPYGKYPDDILISQCRQCLQPACLAACPTGALARDPDHGNVALIDPAKCIGCQNCINACPWSPARPIWNSEGSYSQKCDLCAHADHWDEVGGPDGKKACIEACPLGAIAFSKYVPDQSAPDSYEVNLRDSAWRKLGYPRF